ncbi:hypothetical protein [Sediminitomix flava]|uniref:GLPGLI family protein n=1 Tax=Sediminitomix flava TaxID=379075 RepID=A0A315ZIG5_SEDFL|nr:hypothetical protein [Sediminitomix flava]PWJ45003.1 hypothetical protein BC781_1011401 [Sediminitomix flava]
MKFFLLLVTPLLVISNFCHAQFQQTNVKHLQEIKDRTLLVLEVSIPAKTQKRITKKYGQQKLNEIQNTYVEFNSYVKELITKEWDFNKKVEYMPQDQFLSLSKKQKQKYAVLHFTSYKYSRSSGQLPSSYVILAPELIGEKDQANHKFRELHHALILNRGEKIYASSLKGPIVFVNLPEPYPSFISSKFGIRNIKMTITNRMKGEKITKKGFYAEISKNAKELKNKTLLVKNSSLHKKFSFSQLKKLYKYPVKLVTDVEYEKYFKEESSDYAFLLVIPTVSSTTVIFSTCIIDGASGKYMGFAMPSMGGMLLSANTGGISTIGNIGKIKEKTFSNMIKTANI